MRIFSWFFFGQWRELKRHLNNFPRELCFSFISNQSPATELFSWKILFLEFFVRKNLTKLIWRRLTNKVFWHKKFQENFTNELNRELYLEACFNKFRFLGRMFFPKNILLCSTYFKEGSKKIFVSFSQSEKEIQRKVWISREIKMT